MGNLKSRLVSLEHAQGQAEASVADADEHERQYWLARARLRRNEATGSDVKHARSLIGLFHTQNILLGMSVEELVDRIVSWQPIPEGGRSRNTAQREVGLAIYNREPGTENKACPATWRESFVAADELRERYAVVPDEALAGDGFEPESFGITEGLIERAIGPDLEEITQEEAQWRFEEYLADIFFGERGYGICKRESEAESGGEER